ncbi:thymopoietin b isoform X2 [Gadus chalcogrammus]|uniref:thymopoietin b isoform X2 n=1 Tax=Gadus chalcogrammus TaxID=1042646 RepID=UPI0024C4CDEA|nr:thymopoietin b isoform X2 [Gadus chalcogrammus]
MAEFLEDPSVLTKDKLKNELLANNVALPSGEHKKEVYIQLYLKNLTALNTKSSPPPPDPFSSDDELPTPVVSNRSRSGRKAARKTDRPRTEETDVTEITDEDLREQLVKHGVNTGPIVEAVPEITALADTNQNGNTHTDQYSDKEDEEMGAPEPPPVVERAIRSRGKIPVTTRTSSRRQTKVVEETLASGDQTPTKGSESVVEDILANEFSTPMGISATCRRPIRGAAGRPPKPSEYWLDESLLKRSAQRESRPFSSESLSRGCGDAASEGSGGKAAAACCGGGGGFLCGVLRSLLWLLLLAAVAGAVCYAYTHLDAKRVGTELRGLLDSVVTPLQGAVDHAVAHLGLGAASTADGAGK